jgi:hypothetical protein
MRYTEEGVANALFAYTDEGISLSKAAQMYGISRKCGEDDEGTVDW